MEAKKEIAKKLLEVGAVKLNLIEPYQWASGWKSPIYCDNRVTLSYPEVRDFIKTELSSQIFEQYPDADSIAGVATAGIPQGALVADLLKMPFLYVRSQAKDHGMTNKIEGDISQARKVVMIEDLISTGRSSIDAAKALIDAGLEVEAIFSVFNYGFQEAQDNFSEAALVMQSLTDYETLLEVAIEENKITPEQLESLQKWREAPANWNV